MSIQAIIKLTLTLILSACGQPIQVSNGSQRDQDSTVAGAIRCDTQTGEWFVIDDIDHTPIGIASVDTFSDHIRVNYDYTGQDVVTLLVSVDETYAQLGVIAGASVGVEYADIYFNKPLAELCLVGSNLFIQGIIK